MDTFIDQKLKKYLRRDPVENTNRLLRYNMIFEIAGSATEDGEDKKTIKLKLSKDWITSRLHAKEFLKHQERR